MGRSDLAGQYLHYLIAKKKPTTKSEHEQTCLGEPINRQGKDNPIIGSLVSMDGLVPIVYRQDHSQDLPSKIEVNTHDAALTVHPSRPVSLQDGYEYNVQANANAETR